MIFDMSLQDKGYLPCLPDAHTPGCLEYQKDS